MDKAAQQILPRRMHGLYLSRQWELLPLSHEPLVEYFSDRPKRIKDTALGLEDNICGQTSRII